MSKKWRGRTAQSKRLWTPMRFGLIGSALVLVATIASVFFRGNTDERFRDHRRIEGAPSLGFSDRRI